jgi:hypothetical protein
MTPKESKDKEIIAQLEKENAQLKEQLAGAAKRIEELDRQKPASKSRMQATALLDLLESGPVGMDKLASLNAKYPSDPVYYARTLLKADIKLVRRPGGNVYMLGRDFATYMEGVQREKLQKEASEKEAKEEIPTPQAASHSASGAGAVAVAV